MTEPVLVVHGVANRSRKAFEAQVSELGRKIDAHWQLIPVFWGDLGGQNVDVADTLPLMRAAIRAEAIGIDPALVEAILGGVAAADARAATRATADPESAILDGVNHGARGAAGVPTRAPDEVDAIRQAIGDELPNTRYLRLIRDRAVLEAVGRALSAAGSGAAEGPPAGAALVRAPGAPAGPYGVAAASADTRGLREHIGTVSKAVLKTLDELVGTVVGKSLAQANESLREYAAIPFINFFGDIVAYQRNQQAIHRRLWDAIGRSAAGYGTKQKPINLIAHSLGGVVSFDAALDTARPLWIKTFLTFGSQAPFFHVVDPRRPLAAYTRGHPVTLPETIGSWMNLWEPLDFLAFAASRVFRLASGGSPQDVEVDHLASYGLYTHSAYWGAPQLVSAIRTALA
jgi:hypothetical protein